MNALLNTGAPVALIAIVAVVLLVLNQREKRRAAETLQAVVKSLGLVQREVRPEATRRRGAPAARWTGMRNGLEVTLALVPSRKHSPATTLVTLAAGRGPAVSVGDGLVSPLWAMRVDGPWPTGAAGTSSGDEAFDHEVLLYVTNAWSSMTGPQFVPRFDLSERARAALRSMPPEVYVEFDGVHLTVIRLDWLEQPEQWRELLELVDRLSVLAEIQLPGASATSAPYGAAG